MFSGGSKRNIGKKRVNEYSKYAIPVVFLPSDFSPRKRRFLNLK